MQTANLTLPITANKSEILDKLEQYGIVIIDNYLDEKTTSNLLQEFEQILSTPDNAYTNKIDYSNGRGAKVFREKIKKPNYSTTSKVFGAHFMRTLTNEYLSKEAGLNTEIFVVNDVVGTKHHANDLHFDVQPTFKFFIYLTDTTAENGAFMCVPGSHKITQKIRAKYGDKISYENRHLTRDLPVEEAAKAIPIEGKAGTLIIFTTEAFHKAGTVSKGERKVMRGNCRTTRNNNLSNKIIKKLVQIFK